MPEFGNGNVQKTKDQLYFKVSILKFQISATEFKKFTANALIYEKVNRKSSYFIRSKKCFVFK